MPRLDVETYSEKLVLFQREWRGKSVTRHCLQWIGTHIGVGYPDVGGKPGLCWVSIKLC